MTSQILIKLGDRAVPDFAALVAAYKADELASPSRSTVPLLAFWARPQARFQQLSESLGLDAAGPLEFCFEYPVPVRQGSGKASFTDLMITGGSFAVAIEAKYTEPPYETVRAWLGDSPSNNRQSVLKGWLELIKGATGFALTADEVADRPYQLVHRAASACYPKVQRRWVLYQIFSGDEATYYRDHLSALSRALGDQSALRIGLIFSPPEPTAEFMALAKRWTDGKRDLSASVQRGLLSASLFTFNRVELEDLTKASERR